MHWQDIAIALSYLIFNIALIPSIKGKSKPALATSLLTGAFLFVISLAQLTLGLYLAALAIFINGCLWLVLVFQKVRR